MVTNEARAMGTGHWPTESEPVWVLKHEPTAAQVADAAKVASSKLHGGHGLDFGHRHAGVTGSGWNWWLLLNKRVGWLSKYFQHEHASSGFNPDEGRFVGESKDDFTLPGRWERPIMKAQGERALRRFIDGMDATNSERASHFHTVSPVVTAVQHGDLPAAIHAALAIGLNTDEKGRLIKLLEDEMVYWPDFQRTGSTSADRTIAHHVPKVTSSLTVSQTIGSVSISGASNG